MGSQRERDTQLLILAVALVVRLAFCLAVYPRLAGQFGPGDGYDVIAGNLAAGRGYTLPDVDAPAERLPLYPLLLAAGFRWLGPASWPWQLVQAVMGAATCVLVFRLARAFASQQLAFAAALFCSLHPTLVLFTARPLTETLYVLLTMLFVAAAARRRDALAGALTGLAMLVKSTAILHLIVLVVLRASGFSGYSRPTPDARRPTIFSLPLKQIAMVMAAAAVVVAPWAAWNAAEFGTPHLQTATGGRALYHGLFISRQAGWTIPAGDLNLDAELALRQDLAARGVAADADVTLRDRVAGDLAREWIAAHRAEALAMWLRNLPLTWYLGRSRLSMLIHALLHGPLLLAAAIGGRRIWREHREWRDLVLLCAGLIMAYTLVHAGVQPAVRYILPVVPVAALLAAGCVGKQKEDGSQPS